MPVEDVNPRICSSEEPRLSLNADIYCHLRSGNMTISGSKRHAPSHRPSTYLRSSVTSFLFSLFLMPSLAIIGSLESLSHPHHSTTSFVHS